MGFEDKAVLSLQEYEVHDRRHDLNHAISEGFEQCFIVGSRFNRWIHLNSSTKPCDSRPH